MQLILKIGVWFLQILYLPFKCLPVQNKIVFISRQSEEIPLDYLLICKELEKTNKQLKSVMLIRPIKGGIINKITYLLHMIRQMYHIATAQIVLLDGYCILISVLNHRKTLIIIQMWHAIGALKKFGYSILDKEEGRNREIATVLKMHNNYTYVFASGEKCTKFYAEAFNQPIEKIRIFPLPRLDLLLNRKYHDIIKKRIYEKYPQLCSKEKDIVVYAPTFRKDEAELFSKMNELLKKIDYKKYNVIIKSHPLSRGTINVSEAIVDMDFTTEEMFIVADVIITDYSAVLLEAMLLEKKLILYAYDYKSYCNKRDFYIDYGQVFEAIICENAESVINSLSNFNDLSLKYKSFIKSMVRETKIGYTKEIVLFLKDLLHN